MTQPVFEGDEWKHAADPVADRSPTRAERQQVLDTLYAYGRIDLEVWRAGTDRLSEPQKK